MFNLRAKTPPVAVEVGEGYAAAVRLQRRGERPELLDYKLVKLPYRTQDEKGLWADYKLDERFQEGFAELMDWLEKPRRISLVLPDTATKLFFLEIENDSGSAREMHDMILFKIQKFAPISGEGTTMDYIKLRPRAGGGGHYLVLIASKTLTGSYERYFAQEGIHLGCIESSGLAVADMAAPFVQASPEGNGNFALVRIESRHFTAAVFNNNRLLFGRTKLSHDAATLPVQIGQELKVLSLYAVDQLKGTGFEDVWLYGPGPGVDLAEAALQDAGRSVHRLHLDDFVHVPNQIFRSPDDAGRLMGAVAVAQRS